MAAFDFKTFFQSTPVLLAPMAGVTDRAMRELCVEQGAALAYTEMVSAKGLMYANEKTRKLVDLAPNERAVAVQLFGHEPDVMAHEAAGIAAQLGDALAYIDINMGCPAHKIERKGDGSALMLDPETAVAIVRTIRNAVDVPVTVKFRRGVEIGHETCVDFARRMEQAGACALAVHGRFVKQYYHGDADWGCLARVKQAVGIPVIANGDIKNGDDAKRCLQETGCDALMIGRGACGNPWVFADAVSSVQTGERIARPSLPERMETAKRHARLLAARGERSMVRMRKHAAWYVAGITNASVYRGKINACSTLEQFYELFDTIACTEEDV